MAYADVNAYLEVYDTDMDENRLSTYLGRASRKIDAALSSRGLAVPDNPSEKLSAALSDVCVDMVHRVLGDSGSMSDMGMPDGITSYSQTQAGFTESFSWPQPFTDMKLRDDEMDMLVGMLGGNVTGFGTMRLGGAV